MRSPVAASILAITCSAACSSAPDGADDDADAPPVLEVTAPARGAQSSTPTVTVTGRATDDTAGLRVTVNGVAAALAADGAFSATVDVGGLDIIETRAIDDAGHDVRDVRAVLAGTLAPTGAMVDDAVGARIGADGFGAMSRGIATAVAGANFTAAAMAANPVYENTGCLGATVNVTDVDVGGVEMDLVPTAGAIDTDVRLLNVVVRMHVNYKVACIGGSATVTVSADRARVHGGLGLSISGDALASSLSGVTVGFTGFDVDVNGIPDAVVNLFNGILDDRVAAALAGVVRSRVPALANTALADLTGRTYGVDLLGRTIAVEVRPSQIDIDADGAFVALDSVVTIVGAGDVDYLATPGSVMEGVFGEAKGLGVAVADDTINQLFAGMWSAGMLEQAVPADGPLPLAAILDDETATLDLELSLPPTASTTDDILHLAVGDLIVTGRDAAGVELQRFALSFSTTIAAATSPDGALLLALGPPNVWAQVLAQSDRVDRPMDDEQLEGLVEGVWGLIAPQINDALASLPLPTIGGVSIREATVMPNDGFVVVRAQLVAN
jgi:hypothetical protein